MGKHFVIPDYINYIFDKPGIEWTENERLEVVCWLSDLPQERRATNHCRSRLVFLKGNPESREIDAAIVVEDFMMKNLRGIIDSYNPNVIGGRRFWNYFLFCLDRYCFKERKRILSIGGILPLEPIYDLENGEAESNIANISEISFEMKLENKELISLINEARDRKSIKAEQFEAFYLHFVENYSYDELAKRYHVPEGTVRVWIHRVIKKLRDYLTEVKWPV